MMALGWTLFAALYFIGFAWAVAMDMTNHRGGLIPWRFHWLTLAWPILLLSDTWDSRQAVFDALTGRKVKL